MGEYEKHPLNIGISVAENVIKGFDPEVFNDPNGAPLRMCRNTAMARAAFDQTIALLKKLDESEEAAPLVINLDEGDLDAADANDEVDPDAPADTESQEVSMTLSPDQLSALFGGGAPAGPDPAACFQVAMSLLSVNTASGPETVFPNGQKTLASTPKPSDNNNSGNSTGQYL